MWLLDAGLGFRLADIGRVSLLACADVGLLQGALEGVSYGGPVLGGSALIRARITDWICIFAGLGARYIAFSVASHYSFGTVMPNYSIGVTFSF
jgi:hypothetical protein